MSIKNDNYIQISGWMINELSLKGNELLVYALIHGFCQDGKSVFRGSLNYIMAWLNISKPTCIECLKNLIDKGLIIKAVIHNKNSVAGCEYYTTKSRNIEPEQINEHEKGGKGGKEILPPPKGGKDSLPGWSENLTTGGKEFLPNNTSNNTKDNAAENDLEVLSEKYFGKNAFDADFSRKAAAFFSRTQIKDRDFELYFDFIRRKLAEKQSSKQVKNPRGLAYRLFFQPDIAQEFMESHRLILLEKQKEDERRRKIEERKLICPCCGKRFLPDYISSCPGCDFRIEDFENTEKVNVHINLLKLPEQKKKEYQEELNRIYLCESFLDLMRETPAQREQKEQQEKELNIKYGLVG